LKDNNTKYKYNPLYLPYGDEYKKNNTLKVDDKGEYTTSAAHNSQPDVIQRPNLRYEWNGHNKQWWWSKEKMEKLHNDSRLSYNERGIPRVKKYLHEMEGIPVRDLWIDINQIQGSEKLNYATLFMSAYIEFLCCFSIACIYISVCLLCNFIQFDFII
jgi:hypothetical protein